jgi:hypothetical protein
MLNKWLKEERASTTEKLSHQTGAQILTVILTLNAFDANRQQNFLFYPSFEQVSEAFTEDIDAKLHRLKKCESPEL